MTGSYYLDATVVSEQRQDRLQAAETKLMLQQSGTMRQGWAVRLLYATLHRVGHLLASLGLALIRSTGEPSPVPTSLPPLTGTATGR